MIYRACSNLFVTAYNTELPDPTHFFITLVTLYANISSFENSVDPDQLAASEAS